MKKDFTPDSFEDFIKQSADSLRMKAPDRVWQNLSKDLNKKRRRFITGLSAFLLLATTAGYYLITGNASTQKVLATDSKQSTTKNRVTVTEVASAPSTSSVEAKVIAIQPRSQSSTIALHTDNKGANTMAAVIPFKRKAKAKESIENPAAAETAGTSEFALTVLDDTYPIQATSGKAEINNTLRKAGESFPLSIESITNSYKSKPLSKRFETQLYFTPTISYRKLTENKSYLRGLDPASIPTGYPALYSSVNSHVTHKPNVGFEAGVAVKYALSKNLKIRSGLQFNVNRYDVKAFTSSGSVATIALNTGSRIDSFNTYSTYSNINGYKSDWLQNLSFQLSVPVGVEYLFAGDEKMQFGIAVTVQPTYILGDRAYLITTDYKSYTEVPWLIRRWNVNTSLETFVNFNRWQVGPQVRYQLLSSFVSRYPVKENLFDFGLKAAFRLNK